MAQVKEQQITMDVYVTRNALDAEPDIKALAKTQALESARGVYEANGWRDLRELKAGDIWACTGEVNECGFRIDARAVAHCHITVTGFGVKDSV